MNEEMIREQGNLNPWEGIQNGISFLTWGDYLLIIAFTTIILLVFLQVFFPFSAIFIKETEKNKKKVQIIHFIVASVLNLLVFFGFISLFGQTNFSFLSDLEETELKGTMLNKWEKEQVAPYLASLEEKKSAVEAVKRVDRSPDNYYSSPEGSELVPVSIIHSTPTGEAQTLEARAVIRYDLDQNEEPYMAFKELKESLGYRYKEGKFDVTVHLPKGYQLNQ